MPNTFAAGARAAAVLALALLTAPVAGSDPKDDYTIYFDRLNTGYSLQVMQAEARHPACGAACLPSSRRQARHPACGRSSLPAEQSTGTALPGGLIVRIRGPAGIWLRSG